VQTPLPWPVTAGESVRGVEAKEPEPCPRVAICLVMIVGCCAPVVEDRGAGMVRMVSALVAFADGPAALGLKKRERRNSRKARIGEKEKGRQPWAWDPCLRENR